MIEYIYNLVGGCPYIDDKLLIDLHDKDPSNTAIQTEPTERYLKRYKNGGGMMQYVFDISAKEFSISDDQRKTNIAMCENIANWMENLTKKRLLPVMPKGLQALSLEVITNGYLIDVEQDNNAGRYYIQCRLTYLKRRISK